MAPTLVEKLAEYIVSTNYGDFSAAVIDKAKFCLMDSLGCALGGTLVETGRILLRSAEHSEAGPATVIGGQRKISCTDAAFVNSLLANSLDFDDTYAGPGSPGHPGATVVPPAISVAEKIGASGTDVLEAMLLGYEITSRLLISMKPYVSREGLYGQATCQTLGAAAAVGKLLGLNLEQMSHALGVAGAHAPVPSVMKSVYNPLGLSMVKNNYGSSSETGIRAGFLAKEGFSGPKDLLEGETGFWRMCGASGCDFEVITDGLGMREPEILNVGLKLYPGCWLMQPAIEAAAVIGQGHHLSPERIERITVSTVPTACEWPFNNLDPRSPVAAQFSLPYSVAAALRGVPPGPEWFSPETLNDPLIQSLARKVGLSPDKDADAAHRSGSPIPAEVLLDLRRDSYSHQIRATSGHPVNPLPRTRLEGKFRRSATAVLGSDRADRTLERLAAFERLKDIGGFMDTFHANPSGAG